VRILVTNDDGLHAPGLSALAAALVHAGHDVVAVAPEGDRSGSGAAIGNLGDGAFLRYRPMPLAGLDGIESIELDAPPALCVIAACLGAFGDPPDVVASGINPGLNTGRATLHSGTVGAALTAANFGRSAVAVSLDAREHEARHWDVAGRLAAAVVDWLGRAEDRTVINLSVPDRPADQLAEARHATLAPFGSIRTAVLDRTEDRIELGFVPTPDPLPSASDTALARAGHVVVTPLVGIRPGGPTDLVEHLGAGSAVP
jgi:5'-nucleotidase